MAREGETGGETMKHKPELYTGRQLANRILDHEQTDCHDFSVILDDDDNPREELYASFFVCDWPEHCVTTQHLGDATIHGPYESESEALSIHEDAVEY